MDTIHWKKMTGRWVGALACLVILSLFFSGDYIRQWGNKVMADEEQEQEPVLPDITPPVRKAEPTVEEAMAQFEGDYIWIKKEAVRHGTLYLANDYCNKMLVLQVEAAYDDRIDTEGIVRYYHGSKRSGAVKKKDSGDLFRKMKLQKLQQNKAGAWDLQIQWLLRERTEAVLYETQDAYYITLKNPREIYDKILVVDAGHGGSDEGAPSANGKYIEKEYAMAVVDELRNLWEQDNRVKVYYTRLQDKEVSKKDRVDLANDLDADLFISVHCNASDLGDTSAQGVEALYSKKKVSGNLSNKKLAQLLLKNVVATTGRKKRKVIAREELYLMHHSKVPTSIIEIGYMTNASDMRYMRRAKGRKKIAQGIYKGAMEALGF